MTLVTLTASDLTQWWRPDIECTSSTEEVSPRECYQTTSRHVWHCLPLHCRGTAPPPPGSVSDSDRQGTFRCRECSDARIDHLKKENNLRDDVNDDGSEDYDNENFCDDFGDHDDGKDYDSNDKDDDSNDNLDYDNKTEHIHEMNCNYKNTIYDDINKHWNSTLSVCPVRVIWQTLSSTSRFHSLMVWSPAALNRMLPFLCRHQTDPLWPLKHSKRSRWDQVWTNYKTMKK